MTPTTKNEGTIDEQVQSITSEAIRAAAAEGTDKEKTASHVRAQLRERLGLDSRVKGLNVNKEDGEFTALVAVEGRRGAITVAGELER